MKRWRGIIFAVLMYITLDLSLPAMPGAFVFEPADSVESIRNSRARAAAEVVVLLPATDPSPFVLFHAPDATNDRLIPTSQVERRRPPVKAWSSRSLGDSASSSEDPY